MANSNVPHGAITALDETHKGLCLQASYQIDAMCIALQTAARAEDRECLPYLVQSLSMRINELNGALGNSLVATEDDTATFRQVVHGQNQGVFSC